MDTDNLDFFCFVIVIKKKLHAFVANKKILFILSKKTLRLHARIKKNRNE